MRSSMLGSLSCLLAVTKRVHPFSTSNIVAAHPERPADSQNSFQRLHDVYAATHTCPYIIHALSAPQFIPDRDLYQVDLCPYGYLQVTWVMQLDAQGDVDPKRESMLLTVSGPED